MLDRPKLTVGCSANGRRRTDKIKEVIMEKKSANKGSNKEKDERRVRKNEIGRKGKQKKDIM